jgi:hypothetical protein
MREQLQARLDTLRRHVATVQISLDKVERQRTNLRAVLERTQEAIEMLEVLLAVPDTRTHRSGAWHHTAAVPTCPPFFRPDVHFQAGGIAGQSAARRELERDAVRAHGHAGSGAAWRRQLGAFRT